MCIHTQDLVFCACYVCSFPVHSQNFTCEVDGNVVQCPPVVCPGAQVTFISTALDAIGINLWVFPLGTCPPDNRIELVQTIHFCKGMTGTCGPYTASNVGDPVASSPCLTSSLTVTANISLSSSVIQVGTLSVDGNETTIMDITQLIIIGKKIAMCITCTCRYV